MCATPPRRSCAPPSAAVTSAAASTSSVTSACARCARRRRKHPARGCASSAVRRLLSHRLARAARAPAGAQGEYYALVAELSGQPRPSREVPSWLALGAGHAASWVARFTGAAPTAPADLVRTAAKGNLLFDVSRSKRELGMVYTDIRVAFAEAIDLVTTPSTALAADHADAAERLLDAPAD